MEGQIKSNSGDINCPASSICQLVEGTVLEPADKSVKIVFCILQLRGFRDIWMK